MREKKKKKVEYKFDKRSIPGIIIFILFLVIGLSLFFYWRNQREAEEVENQVTVAATVFPVYDMLSVIENGQTDIEIFQVVPAAFDPRDFEPSDKDKMKLSEVDYVFKIGTGYDDWVNEFVGDETKMVDLSQLVNVRNADKPDQSLKLFCESSEGIWVEETNECEWLSKDQCGEFGGQYNECASTCRNSPEGEYCIEQCVAVCKFEESDEEETNPYYWLSIENAKKISATVFTVLAEQNPQYSNELTNQYQQYIESLDETRSYIQESFAQMDEQEVFVASYSFDYLLDEMKMQREFVPYVENKDDQLVILESSQQQPVYIDKKTDFVKSSEDFEVIQIDIFGISQGSDNYIDTLRGLVDKIVENEVEREIEPLND